MSTSQTHHVKSCPRCSGPVFHWLDAIVPGDPLARRGSRRALPHRQPAWVCVACGHLEREERRSARIAERQAT